MGLEVRQIIQFSFSMQVAETTFTFNIPAENQPEACRKLIFALEKIMQELKAMAKPGPN